MNVCGGMESGLERTEALSQQVQDFKRPHLYHFLQGGGWPASLVGAGMRHGGDGRGERGMVEVNGADFRLPSGILYLLYFLGAEEPAAARMWPVVWSQERLLSLLSHCFASFLSSELTSKSCGFLPIDMFAPLHSCRPFSSPPSSASGQSSPGLP